MNNEFDHIEIERLKFDPENPRLPISLHNASEKDIIEWMLNDASLIDLIASIAENGFFQGEPIIVIKDGKNYVVIEGNRRLAAVKILNNPQLAKSYRSTIDGIVDIARKKKHVPEKIFSFISPSRDDVRNYLGFRHVTGVKSWDVLAKSRFLFKIYEDSDINSPSVYKNIAREIGSKAPYVKRLILGYKLFLKIKSKKFYLIKDINEEDIDLSLLTDAATMNGFIADWLKFDAKKVDPIKGVDEKNLQLLTRWLYEKNEMGITRIPETRSIKIFNKILQYSLAKDEFIKGNKTLEEALELTDFADETISSYIAKSLTVLRDAQSILHRAESPSPSDINNLLELQAMVSLILGILTQKQLAASVKR